jgi:hypothetical protein
MPSSSKPESASSPPEERVGPRATFIILSYARPRNIQRILDDILASRSCEHIVLSNNNPDIDIHDHIVRDQPGRVTVVQQKEHWEPVIRFMLARDMPGDYFVCIDDDLFLTPAQIDALVDHLHADPSVPHGVWGERIKKTDDTFRIDRGLHNIDGEVDVLNRAYAFTRRHVQRYFELLALIGVRQPRKLGRGDDQVLSFSGAHKPMCHDLGPIENCPTADQDGIALWRQKGFYEERMKLYVKLLQATGRE